MIQFIKQRPLLFILLFSFLIRFVYFIAIASLNPDGYYMYDSYGYWQIAYNVKEYGIFSQSYELPIEPDYYRTPLYPLFIILAESVQIETYPIIFLQIVLGVAATFYTYKLSKAISNNLFIANISALFMALDIPNIVMNNIVMTETLFTFLLLITFYYFVRYMQTNERKLLLLSAVLCGLTILCRPIGFFLPVFFSAFLLIKFWSEKKKAFINIILFSIITIIMISPWLLRNKSTFGHYFMSVIREHDMQNYQAAAVYGEVHHKSLPEAQSTLRWKTFKSFPGDANKQPYEYARYIENDAMDFVFEHPGILIKHHTEQFMHFFLKPCRAYIDIQLGHWGAGYNTIPKNYPIFKYLFEHNSKLTISIVFFQLGMLLVMYLACLFSFFYFKQEKQLFYFLLSALLVLCFANLTLPYVTESRFRVPMVPYLSMIAAAGIFFVKEKIILWKQRKH